MENSWSNPFEPSHELVSISTGTVASPDISQDLPRAHEMGKKDYTEFKHKRIESVSCVKFHDRLKKHSLKSFSSMKGEKEVNVKKLSLKQTIDSLDARYW